MDNSTNVQNSLSSYDAVYSKRNPFTTLPSEHDLSDKLLGTVFLEGAEVTVNLIIHGVHNVEDRLRVENLVAEIGDEHRALLKLKD